MPFLQLVCRSQRVCIPSLAIILYLFIRIVSYILKTPLVPTEASPREQWERDRRDWDAQLQETWYVDQVEEPENLVGKSILVRWLDPLEAKEKKGWRCCVPLEGETWCEDEIERIDRAIIHVRVHLDLKPYPCEGHCNEENWYAEKPLPPKYPNIVTARRVSLQRSTVPLITRDQTGERVNGGKSETLELALFDSQL